MREMFDAIAPRYDLVNRIMTFRLDVRWRRRAGRGPRPRPPAAACSTWPAAPATCASTSPPPGYRPISIDLSLGMLRADRSGAPRVQADILRLPVADGSVDGVTCGFALRNLVDLPAFFAELGRVVRPGGRIALLDVGVPAQPRSCAGATASTSARSCRAIGGWLSDPAAYRYLPRSVAYLPPPDEMVAQLRARRVRRRRRTASSRCGITQLLTGTARTADAGRHPRSPTTRPRALDLNDVARGDGFLFVRDGVGLAGRGVAARVAGRRRAGAARPRSTTTDRPTVRARRRPGRHRLGAVRPGRRRRGRRPRRRRRQGAPTAGAGSPRIDGAVEALGAAGAAAARRPTPTRSSRSRPIEHVPRRRRRGPRRGARRAARPRR